MLEQRGLGEQALSKAAEIGLTSQLDETESLEVDINTDPLKLVQGQVDAVTIVGEGMVMQKDLHVQKVELHADHISIDPFSALFGKIELNQPINSTGQIVVTEADINQSLNSDYVLSQLAPLELNVEGRIVSLTLQPPIELRLPGDNKLVFSSNLQVPEKGNTQQVHFTGRMYPRTDEHPVLMEGFSFEEGQAVRLDVMVAFMEKLKELVNLPHLEFSGTTFRIKQMQVHQGSITLQVEAQINQLPSL